MPPHYTFGNQRVHVRLLAKISAEASARLDELGRGRLLLGASVCLGLLFLAAGFSKWFAVPLVVVGAWTAVGPNPYRKRG